MSYPRKIVTCCYCGARAALVLKGKSRHELACANCGAPLHDLKMLPKSRSGDRELVDSPRPGAFAVSHKASPKKRRAKKQRKGFLSHLVEEVFDIVEDVFD